VVGGQQPAAQITQDIIEANRALPSEPARQTGDYSGAGDRGWAQKLKNAPSADLPKELAIELFSLRDPSPDSGRNRQQHQGRQKLISAAR